MRIEVFLGLFLPVMLAGLSVFFLKMNTRLLKLLVAFSGAYLISLIFNELVPQIYSSISADTHIHGADCDHGHGHSHNSMHHVIGLLILGGFFLQLILDYLTKGIEHGHIGHHHHNHHHEEDTHKHLSLFPVMAGLFLHSFLEAMPLAKGFAVHELQNKLLIGIVVHNIPISIVLVTLFKHNKTSFTKAFILLLVFALSGPAGALFANLLGHQIAGITDNFFNYTMAVVVGLLLHIATTILFETDENHSFNLIKFATMVLGALVAIIHF